MHSHLRSVALAARVFAPLVAALCSSVALAQSTERMSVTSGGVQGNSLSYDSAVSADGRYVAFGSSASNLVAGDTNNQDDIFVRDRQTGTTERVSIATNGAQGNFASVQPCISADGRFVAFASYSSTFTAGDANGQADIFLRDRQLGTLERVSLGTGGTAGNQNCFGPSMSADGRYVSFQSLASNLVAGDTNAVIDVFLRDRQLGSLERVTVSTSGTQADSTSDGSAMSADGRFVAFHSDATNLVAVDPNGGFSDVFVRDLVNGTTERVSIGLQGVGGGSSPSISGDGRFVAFHSGASDLVVGDTNFNDDVFLRDRLSGTTERVNLAVGGGQSTSGGNYASVSSDGRFVAFQSGASDLITGDTNGLQDIYVRDRQTGTNQCASVATGGAQATDQSYYPTISADGRYVVFESNAANLVVGDTNSNTDVFLRDTAGALQQLAFCFGDGTGTACPCGTGIAGNGCPSSVNPSGAHLGAAGVASIAADTVVLFGSGMPQGSALYFQGTTQVAGGAGSVFGDGLRCVGGSTVRLATKNNVSGGSQFPAAGDPLLHVKGGVAAGDVRHYQAWYRNAAVFCNPQTFNLTNGWTLTWLP